MTSDLPGFFQGTEMPNAGWWEALWPEPAEVVATVGIEPGMTVVDLCSGDGWFTLPIARLARRVTAIDIDPDLLDVTRRRLREAGAANVDLIASDAYEISAVVREPVDFVFLANAFHGVPDRPKLARGVAETLRPGGRFAIVSWHKRPREETVVLGEPRGPRTELRMSPEDTAEAVEAGGLTRSRVIEVPPYHYAAIFARPAS